jgi:hypothetical protein
VTRARYALPLALLVAGPAARAAPLALKFQQSMYQDGSEVALVQPEGVACSDSGAAIVADTGNQRLITFTVKDGQLGAGTAVKLPQLTAPERVELDRKGGALVLDGRTRRIGRTTAAGAYAGSVEIKGIAGASSVVPGSFKIDAADNVYVLDVAGRRVLVVNPAGAVSRQLELPKSGTFTDVAVDAAGTVFAVDAVGAVVWAAASGASAFSPLTRSMKDRISFPTHMLARKGTLFLVDQHGNGIVAVGIDGSYQGRQLAMGWTDGLVYYPSQLCITDGGVVLVADRNNNRVQYFTVVQ